MAYAFIDHLAVTNSIQLTNKAYWVTGASSGIGKSIAIHLLERGEQVVISARRAADLEAVKQSVKNPERCLVVPLDLSANDHFAAVVDHVEKQLGRGVDVMIHCGGISQRSLAIETTAEVDRTMMEVNYFGTVALTRALLPRFMARKHGQFVVITSLMGVFSSPLRSSYCAAKHALHGYFEALRAEVYSSGVFITMVCPGFIQTDISRNALTGDGSAQMTMDAATGSGMTARECARQIVKATDQRKPEVYIGKKEILGVYLKRFFPGLLRRVIRKSNVT